MLISLNLFNWKYTLLRGILTAVFGALLLFVPEFSLLALIFLFGAFIALDGLIELVNLFTRAERTDAWWGLLIRGILELLIGILIFIMPNVTAIVLLYLIAFWAILIGIFELVYAIRIREVVQGEWLLAVSGVLSIAIGILLAVWPIPGVLAVTWLIGLYALIMGIILIINAIRLKKMGAGTV
ncbi:MAG: HdeD family acid-resistance protein [Spirochaetia bacterium]